MTKYYKHPAYGHVYGKELVTPVGRIVFPSLVTPKDPPPPKDGKPPGSPRYETTLLLKKGQEKTTAFLLEVKGMTDEMIELFNDKRPAKLGEVALAQDGDTFDMEKYPYYAGNWVIPMRNVEKPAVIGLDKQEIDPATVSGGMEARAVVTPLVTAHGISYKLAVIQLVRDDGTRFGGGMRDPKTFLDAIGDDLPAEETQSAVAVETPAATPAQAAQPVTTHVALNPAQEAAARRNAATGKKAMVDIL